MQSSIPYRSGLIHIGSFQPVQTSGRIPRFDADASKPRFIGSRPTRQTGLLERRSRNRLSRDALDRSTLIGMFTIIRIFCVIQNSFLRKQRQDEHWCPV